MATNEQLNYFKDIYLEEKARGHELIDRGKLFLSIITLYMGLLGVAANKLIPKLATNNVIIFCYLTGFLLLVIALLLIVLAIGLYKYVYPSDPERIITQSNEAWPNNEQFFLERIAELASAFKLNHPINDKRGLHLKWASFLMALGIIFQAIAFSFLIFV